VVLVVEVDLTGIFLSDVNVWHGGFSFSWCTRWS
jgi:hypothetical protein